MKKNPLSFAAVACIIIASQLISCKSSFDPVRTEEPVLHSRYGSGRYRPNQVIVMYKKRPTSSDKNGLRNKINGQFFDASALTTRQCNSCEGFVELWEAPNIHTRIHRDGLAAGSKSPGGSQPVGEDGLAYYSLNFIQKIPVDSLPVFGDFDYSGLTKKENNKEGKEVVRVAVLDTGIDARRIISPSYLWNNQEPSKCYQNDTFGWNFVTGSPDVMDNNKHRHGTLVSQYIINEFAASRTKAVELMTLKTHDEDGFGDLFWSICAIHYAIEKKADIINASWGFYYYKDGPYPYLDSLITQVLRKEGILFVAAAGNRIVDDDAFAHDAYRNAHGGADIPDSYLRNLEYHNFYPACLSRADNNNVVTVTTANKNRVSPSQNYSNKFVDIGAIPDDPIGMRFKEPFNFETGAAGAATTISGSSFATAIVTGRIGAFLPNSFYMPNIDKSVVLDHMESAGLATKSPTLEAEHIRKGRITKHN